MGWWCRSGGSSRSLLAKLVPVRTRQSGRFPVTRSRLGLLAACVTLSWVCAGDALAADKRELRRRTITIDDASLTSVPEIRVAGGTPTILTFEVPVKEGGAVLADVRGVFYPPTQTDRTVM